MTNPEKISDDLPLENVEDQQTGSKATDSKQGGEAQPRLTLLESGQSPGEVLRIAREKHGFSLEEVSQRTKINIHQLKAIENGDTSKFPPETFARAFVKSYCKLVGLEAAPILAAYGLDAPSASASPDRSNLRSEGVNASMPSSSRRLSSLSFDRPGGNKRVGYVVLLAVAAVLAGFYIPEFLGGSSGEPEIVVPPESAAVAPAAGVEESQLVPVAPSVEINQDGVVQESIVLPEASPVANGETPTDPELAAASRVFPALQKQAESPSAESSSLLASGGGLTDANSKVSDTTLAEPPAPAASEGGKLTFSFEKESWVTVRDSKDKVLMSRLNQAGETAEVQGEAPFKLIIGNAASVTLAHDGQAVDLSPHIKGEVARLTVE